MDSLKNNDIPIDEIGLIKFFEKYYNMNRNNIKRDIMIIKDRKQSQC